MFSVACLVGRSKQMMKYLLLYFSVLSLFSGLGFCPRGSLKLGNSCLVLSNDLWIGNEC